MAEIANIGTVIGRYYAMDRDKRWERVQLAYDLIAAGQGRAFPDRRSPPSRPATRKTSPMNSSCPPRIGDYAGMQDGDAILSFNFRADRVREILTALLDPAFDGFARTAPKFSAAVGMTAYSDALAPFMHTLFAPQRHGLTCWARSWRPRA